MSLGECFSSNINVNRYVYVCVYVYVYIGRKQNLLIAKWALRQTCITM